MPTRGKARKIGVRVETRPVLSPRQNGEFADSASSSGRWTRIPLATWIALSGLVDAHVDVDAEDQLLARDELQPGDQVAVARARRRSAGPPTSRTGGSPRRRSRARAPSAPRSDLPAQRAQLAARLARVRARRRRDLADRLHQLGLDLARGSSPRRPSSRPSIEFDEIERLGIDDHELLLDAERVARAREPVLHGGIVSARTALKRRVCCSETRSRNEVGPYRWRSATTESSTSSRSTTAGRSRRRCSGSRAIRRRSRRSRSPTPST